MIFKLACRASDTVSSRITGLCSLAFLLALLQGFTAQTFAAEAPQEGLELEGTLIQGGILRGRVAPGSRVLLNDTALEVSPEGRFVLGFDRDNRRDEVLKVIVPDGRVEQRALRVARRDYDIQRIEGIAPRIMSPGEADLQRIREDSRQVARARTQNLARADFAAEFRWPLKGPITGVFGSQRVYNGEPRRPHYGVDVAAPVGTLVYAPAGGLVTLAHPDMFYSGGTLIIDHGHHLSSSFLHLSEILVKSGEQVLQGQPIARVGATGRVTGPHLDWRMNWRDRRVDPAQLVPPMDSLEQLNKSPEPVADSHEPLKSSHEASIDSHEPSIGSHEPGAATHSADAG